MNNSKGQLLMKTKVVKNLFAGKIPKNGFIFPDLKQEKVNISNQAF